MLCGFTGLGPDADKLGSLLARMHHFSGTLDFYKGFVSGKDKKKIYSLQLYLTNDYIR